MNKRYLIILLCLFFLVGCSGGNSSLINYVQAKEQIINHGALLLDVRTQEEYDNDHIDGAILFTLDTITDSTASEVISSKDTPVIVYCQSGNRSHQALEKLQDLGYKNVYDLGSISNWKE